ncbi:MAG: hypothetical protein HC809_16645 [Gammaproteobacteria bacterium]|nr:hypothetical protein [Gammaproteobacteria bacterium]
MSGLDEWFAHLGLAIEEQMVMDPQNAAFPIPVTRQAGGFSFQEMHMLDYPYFVDVRDAGLSSDNGITADLPQVTMAWSSPIVIDVQKNASRSVVELLRSSPASWRSESTNVMPRIDAAGQSAFAPEGAQSAAVLGVALEGVFNSYFADKPNPLLAEGATPEEPDEASAADSDGEADPGAGVISGVIDKSPESARLIVFSSNDFLSDQILGVIGSAEGTVYGNSSAADDQCGGLVSRDRDLLSIRSRGHFNRTLPPLEQDEQTLVEWLNYLLGLFGVALVFFIYRNRSNARNKRYRSWLAEGSA